MPHWACTLLYLSVTNEAEKVTKHSDKDTKELCTVYTEKYKGNRDKQFYNFGTSTQQKEDSGFDIPKCPKCGQLFCDCKLRCTRCGQLFCDCNIKSIE